MIVLGTTNRGDEMEPYQQLELDWAKANDLDPSGMVACSSGTAALHLGLEALQLPPGSEVIVPDFTMIACPRAVTLAGLRPVFVDCDSRLLMDLSQVFDALKPNEGVRRVVMPVHIYGRVVDTYCLHEMYPVLEDSSVYVIEDLAEAHGVRPYKLTDVACWSFYKNKIVAGEEGGAVWFRNLGHAHLARQLRSLGFTSKHDFTHVPRGHNYRMSNAHASLILPSIAKLEDNLADRRSIEWEYNQACPEEWKQSARNAVWVYDIRIPGMTSGIQNLIVQSLQLVGIGARYGFKPMTLQEEYRTMSRDGQMVLSHCWESFKASREVIYLPVEPGMLITRGQIQTSFQVIRRVLGGD